MRNIFFVSTCGTSLITRGIESHERSRLATLAHRSESELDGLEKDFLEEILGRAEKKLFEATQHKACSMSAELSGLAAWRSSHQDEGVFEQVLLHSATFVGQRCAETIRAWCSAQGWTTSCRAMDDLNVTEPVVFRSAVSNLFSYCHDELAPRRSAGIFVVLNLTGGYKAMQGLLQTAGTLYADEMFYLFEGSTEILSLPRLPLEIDDALLAHVLEHESLMRRLGQEAVPVGECLDVTPVLLDVVDDQAMLSPLGELIVSEASKLSEKEQYDLKKVHEPILTKERSGGSVSLLCSCGTSILTNVLRSNQKDLDRLHGMTTQKEVAREDQKWLDEIAQRIREKFLKSSLQEVRQMSAELNGLLGWYAEDSKRHEEEKNNRHVLVHSDTAVGKCAAELIQSWCQRQSWSCEVVAIEHLTAASSEKFLHGTSKLVELCQNLRDESKGKVVYNLVGGWKALQGFLQTLGTFYADDVIYLHEESDCLLHMVPLPVRLEKGFIKDVERHLVALRRLLANCELNEKDHQSLDDPSMALFTTGQGKERRFTPWGLTMFEKAREEIYGQKLWPSPDERIVFGKNFQKSFETESTLKEGRWLYEVNLRLDSLLRYITSKGEENPNSLKVKPWRGNSYAPSDWEMRAWTQASGWRILMHKDGSCWVLDWIIPHS